MESISPFHYVLNAFNGDQFTMILGQEPDDFNGAFDKRQSLRGKLSELNIWNYTLPDNTIQKIANCNEQYKGNILSWEKRYLTVFGTTFIDIEESQFCQPIVYQVPVIKRLSQDEAEMYCSVHGGSVYTPTSIQSNADLLKLMNNSIQECGESGSKFFLWLGIAQEANNSWVYSNNKSPITYKNNLRSSEEESCAVMQKEGIWDVRHKDECQKLRLCFVCHFEQEPVFTLLGLACMSSYYDFLYYLSPSAKGIEFIGYKDSKIWEEDQTWHLGWDINGQYANSSLDLLSHPLGRHSWQIFDYMCEEFNANQTLTLSTCNFRKDFTCNSGQCVDISKQCDQYNDCADASDEVDCTSIIPEANYSPLEPPTIQGQSNPLWTNVKILQFDKVDTLEMHLTLTMEVEVRWYDQRINFANLKLNCSDNISDITG